MFKEMKVFGGEGGEIDACVSVCFPKNWVVDDAETEEKFGVKVASENSIFYFWAPIDVGMDKVFDAVEHTVKRNKEAQMKAELFEEKLKELKDLFYDEKNTLEDLKGLRFEFEQKLNQIPPGAKGKK